MNYSEHSVVEPLKKAYGIAYILSSKPKEKFLEIDSNIISLALAFYKMPFVPLSFQRATSRMQCIPIYLKDKGSGQGDCPENAE